MIKFQLNKLVRDKLLETYYGLGQKPKYRTLKTKEHQEELTRKVVEEASELISATKEELIEEIADVEQALDDLKKLCKINEAELTKIKKHKIEKKGAFERGIYIETLDLQDDDPWVKYYQKEPKRYPEIK